VICLNLFVTRNPKFDAVEMFFRVAVKNLRPVAKEFWTGAIQKVKQNWNSIPSWTEIFSGCVLLLAKQQSMNSKLFQVLCP